MSSYVVDTHALFWYLTGSPRLGRSEKQVFVDAESGHAELIVPAIVLAELYFLNEKLGLSSDFAEDFRRLGESGQFSFVALLPEHVLGFDDARGIAEMHDRIIVGVARRLQVPLLTKDARITQSGLVGTIW